MELTKTNLCYGQVSYKAERNAKIYMNWKAQRKEHIMEAL